MTKHLVPGQTTALGLGSPHQKRRQLLAPIVAEGRTLCARCHEPIRPGEPWDLGHVDGSNRQAGYTGPEHRRCNRATAGRKSWLLPPPEPEPERDGLEPSMIARWDVPWLKGLRRVPKDATWPRLMTVPHPRAVRVAGCGVHSWRRETHGAAVALVAAPGRCPVARGRQGRAAGLGNRCVCRWPASWASRGCCASSFCGGSIRATGSASRRTCCTRGRTWRFARRSSGRPGRGQGRSRTFTRCGR